MSPRIAFLGIGSIGFTSIRDEETGNLVRVPNARVDAVFSARRTCCDCHVDGVRLDGPCSCDDGVRVVEVFADELDHDDVAWLHASGDENALAIWHRWGDADACDCAAMTTPASEGMAA